MTKLLQNFTENLVKKSYYKSDQNAYLHSCVSVIGGLLGNLVKSKEEKIFPNLYSMLLGSTGQGKSSYCMEVKGYVSRIQTYKNRLHLQEKRKRKALIAEEKKKKLADPNYVSTYKPLPFPKATYYQERSYYVDDATTEALMEYAAKVSWGNMFLFKDELGGFFDSFKKKGREEDQSFYNTLYKSDHTFEVLRKMKEAKIPVSHNPVMNLMGCTTIGTAHELIASYKKKKRFDGIWSRFQHVYILPKLTEADLAIVTPEEVDTDFDKPFKGLLNAIIDRQILVGKLKKAETLSDDLEGEEYKDFITYIGRTKEAQEIFSEYAFGVRKRMFNCENPMLKEYLVRSSDLVVKIALIFYIVRSFELGVEMFSESTDNKINAATMLQAIEYVEMITKNASLLYEEGIDVDGEFNGVAGDILNYITKKDGNFFFKYKEKLWTDRDLARTQSKVLPRKSNKTIDREVLEEVLELLVEKGSIYSQEVIVPPNKTITKYSFTKIEEEPKPEPTKPRPKAPEPEQKTETRPEQPRKPAPETVIVYPTKEENNAHLNDLKAHINIENYVKQYVSLNASGLGRCPFHDDKTPSFSINRAENKFSCFGACKISNGTIIDFVMKYHNVQFLAAKDILESYSNKKLDLKTEKLITRILEQSTLNSIYAPYLRNRLKGYSLALSNSVKYCGSLYYQEGAYQAKHPAMVVSITNKSDEIIGLQRIYLSDDLSQKRDLGNMPSKKILGKRNGGYVNLIDLETSTTLIIGEGVETVLSLYITNNNPANTSVFATLGSSNIPDLPDKFKKIIIAQDNDEAGESFVAAIKSQYKHLEIEVMAPSEEFNDWNDALIRINASYC